MTDETVHITRRKVLAGLSAIGASGAAAGLGTSAVFSDTESFEENAIAVGELDLAVNWEEHYSHPQGIADAAFDDPAAGLDHDVVRSGQGGSSYVGLPDPEDPEIWVHRDDIEEFMANTAIEAFPDLDSDGQQELTGELDGEQFTYDPCEHGASLPDHLDPGGLRTDNADTRGESDPVPLVSLSDVKPGDFGELTLGFQLCGNPGYVWLRADDTHDGGDELAEEIETAWWYDTDGDNVLDQSSGPVDVMLAVDTSDSLSKWDVERLADHANDLARALEDDGNVRVGGLTFGDGDISNFSALDEGPVEFEHLEPEGDTPLPAAMEISAAELDSAGRPDAKTVVVVFTDGGPNYENNQYRAGGHEVGTDYEHGGDYGEVTDGELCEAADVAKAVRSDHTLLAVGIDDDRPPTGNRHPEVCDDGIDSLRQYLRDYVAGSPATYFHAKDIDSLGPLLDSIQTTIETGEQVFRRGTLASDLERLSEGYGVPLDGNLGTDFDEIDDDPTADVRECFQPGSPTYIGFAWWLPLDTGNEIQNDSVSFDLGFYAEQCRNTDGRGSSS